MIEHMTDSHRQLLLVLATQAWVRIRHDPEMVPESDEIEAVVRMLSGTDTKVFVERTYPSLPSSR